MWSTGARAQRRSVGLVGHARLQEVHSARVDCGQRGSTRKRSQTQARARGVGRAQRGCRATRAGGVEKSVGAQALRGDLVGGAQ